MKNNQLRALIMALLCPSGTAININDHMWKCLEANTDEIMKRCEDKDATKKG